MSTSIITNIYFFYFFVDFRKSKRLYYGKATLFADYAFLPKHMEESFTTYNDTYAIEIKPKLGWIPLSKQNNKKCQFCQNQYLKVKFLI